AHFTSPIRRYSDLVVHRALIRALGLGKDGLTEREVAELSGIAEHLVMTERRSMAAERDATDRYVAAFLEERIGATFEGRITGVTRFGLFVRLQETGADGLIPISSLGRDYFQHDEAAHALIGQRSGDRWTLGRTVEVKLVEATPLTGGLVLEMLSDAEEGKPPGNSGSRGGPRGGPLRGGKGPRGGKGGPPSGKPKGPRRRK
ncbi:MAG TPA: ribonuclease R, partial [Brevundimonas sp.]|nr:ribonuclease R [Brevundimonas sp.]